MRNEDGAPRSGSVIRRESSGKKLIDQSRVRLFCITAFFLLCFLTLSYRLIEISVFHRAPSTPQTTVSEPEFATEPVAEPLVAAEDGTPALRGDIVDRNGVVLATSLATESLFANPHDLLNPDDAARKLAAAFPELRARDLARKLRRDASFVWIKRNLTPREQWTANNLGLPGLYFRPEEKRIYPDGNLLSHLIGFVGVDHRGLAGIERSFDARLRDPRERRQPLRLSLDLRVQSILYEEMKQGMESAGAIGATGVVLDLRSGEILALANLPDFDPHQPTAAPEAARFNRASLGTYEMGSTFKTFTMANALESGIAGLSDTFDATHPIEYARFTINDAHPLNRWLTIPEIYAYSSNIGTVRVAMKLGTERERSFLRRLGLMAPLSLELPELGAPHYPADWKEINTMTIAYGHGMAVTPLHLVRAFAAIANGGRLETLTLLKDGNAGKEDAWPRVVSEKTSREMRRLMRMVVEYGTAKKADVPGYRVGGKTGTAEKVGSGGYSHSAKLALFISAFPVDEPRYVVLMMIDEPKGSKSTYGFATGGWISAPIVANIISRMAPMLGIPPLFDLPTDGDQRWVNSANQRFLHAVSY